MAALTELPLVTKEEEELSSLAPMLTSVKLQSAHYLMDSSSGSEEQEAQTNADYGLLVQRQRAKVALALQQCLQAGKDFTASCTEDKNPRAPRRPREPTVRTRNSERLAGQKQPSYQEESYQRLYRNYVPYLCMTSSRQ